jgi:calcium-dependent protein kinase
MCFQLSTNKKFAVKIVSKVGLPSDHLKRKVVESQFKLIRSMDHPSVLKLHDFFEDSCNYYLVMEYVKGGDLLTKLEKTGRLSEKEAAKVMKQLLSALAFMHSHNVIHRDVKCENVLIEENQGQVVVKLIDFDTIIQLSDDKKCVGKYGTVYYMAPEVINGAYNEKCDIWSAGIVLYSMITKTFPFGGTCDEAIMRNITTTKINFAGLKIWRASDELINFLQILLDPCPASRISARKACSHPWIMKHSKTSVIPNSPSFSGSSFALGLSQALKTWALKSVVPGKDLAEYHMMFINIDKDLDGVISREDLRGLYENEGIVEKIMKIADLDGNGVLEYHEFLSVVVQGDIVRKYSDKIVAELDKDNSGKVSVNSLVSFLEYALQEKIKEAGLCTFSELSDTEILDLICS